MMSISFIEIKDYCKDFTCIGLVPYQYIDKYFDRGLLRKLLKWIGVYYNIVYFLKNENDNFLGGIVLRKKLDLNKVSFTWWIYNVYVREEYRGKGYGEILLNQTYDILKKKGIKRVLLKVGKKNKIAINLYKKHGFLKKSEDNNDIVMFKYLI